MARTRVSMRKIRDILRLQAEGLSDRQIARSLGLSHRTVGAYRQRAQAAGLGWPVPAELDDGALQARLFPAAAVSRAARPQPDWATIHRELRRQGVTLRLLWLEYKAVHPEGYQYTQFTQRYRRWSGQLDLALRQDYKAGEKAFVDYAGQTVPVVDPDSGQVRQAQIFVGVLGASNYLYAEATWTQALADWIGAHVRMYAAWGGVPAITVPDNTTTGVRHACFYEPDLNPTYQELAVHYGTAVIPARVRRPRDKAKVETGVQLVERWVLAPLRHQRFFSLAELNQAMIGLRDALNARPFQKLPGSRQTLFETLEQPALRPLPSTPYELAVWKKARVNIDYHIQVEGHLYSVPYPLVRREVDVRLTASAVEVLHRGRRVAAHLRSRAKGGYTTDPAHRPKAHQQHLAWSPSRLIRWAETIGPASGQLAQQILQSRPHPEQGYRACLGLMRLAKRYSNERLEAACRRALHSGTPSYRSVKSILEHRLDQQPLEAQARLALPAQHAHLRGPAYYASPKGDH